MLKSTNQPLSEAYSLALLDLDGVVYRGKNPVEHAAKNIRKAESLGMTVEYTTNNSSRLQAVVADQLKGFDLDVESWQVITSSVVAAAHGGTVPCLKVRRFSCLAPSICVRKWPSKVLKRRFRRSAAGRRHPRMVSRHVLERNGPNRLCR